MSSMLQLSTGLWGHIFGFGHLSAVGRIPQTCKTLSSLLLAKSSLTSGSSSSTTLVLPLINVCTMGDKWIVMHKLMALGVRRVHCSGPFTTETALHPGFLENLRFLHIGCVARNKVWLALVTFCQRLEVLIVDDALCPPLFPLCEGQATFHNMRHLRQLILPQRPYRTRANSDHVLEQRQYAVAAIIDALEQPEPAGHRILNEVAYPILKGLVTEAGDAYSMWTIGHLIDIGLLLPIGEAPAIQSIVQRFYGWSADRGFAMAQFALSVKLSTLQQQQGQQTKAALPFTTTTRLATNAVAVKEDTKEDEGWDCLNLLYNAARQYNVCAMTTLAHVYRQKKEYERMAIYFRQSAELGDIDAMYETGYCHYYGIGVPTMDDNEAFKWFDRAANTHALKHTRSCIPYEPGPPWRQYPRQLGHLYYYLGLFKMATGAYRDLQGAVDCFVASIDEYTRQQARGQGGGPPASFVCTLKLHLEVLRWALLREEEEGLKVKTVDKDKDDDDDDDQKSGGAGIMTLEPSCPQIRYWQCRYRAITRTSGSHGNATERADLVDHTTDQYPDYHHHHHYGSLDDYWRDARASDHVSNATLELCFHPPNERLVLKLLHAAVGINLLKTSKDDGKLPTTMADDDEAARPRIRTFFMLGEAAERAGDMTLAKTWYERSAASSPYVQAHRKLDTLGNRQAPLALKLKPEVLKPSKPQTR